MRKRSRLEVVVTDRLRFYKASPRGIDVSVWQEKRPKTPTAFPTK